VTKCYGAIRAVDDVSFEVPRGEVLALPVYPELTAEQVKQAEAKHVLQVYRRAPIVLVRGLSWSAPDAPGLALVRPPEHDLFR